MSITGKLLTAFFLLVIISSLAFAHETGEISGKYDIEISPQSAFQGDEVAMEATITLDNTLVPELVVNFVFENDYAKISEKLQATERSPGKYMIKYTFQNSGSYVLHVETGDGEEAQVSTFQIPVGGGSLDMAKQILVVVAFLLCLIFLYTAKSRKLKTGIVLSLIILLTAGLAYSVVIVHTSGAAQRGVKVCVSDSECYWSAHIHAELELDICGDASYRFPIEVGPLDGPHTHEEKNRIHFHERLRIDPKTEIILNTSLLHVGTFLDNMEVEFSRDMIQDKKNGDVCNDKPGYVKMYVNEKPNGAFRDYVWKDGDKIRIVFDENLPENTVDNADVTTFDAPEISLPIIIGFALIDSINPCVIGVLLLLITVLLKAKKKKSVLVNGLVYTIGVYVTYLVGGITLLSIFNAVREIQVLSQIFYVAIGIFVLVAGFIEVKDYFWYGRGFALAIPARFVRTIKSNAKTSKASLVGAFMFGAIVTLIELPCTGAPYLALITMMSQSGVQFYSAFTLLMLYNLVFVLPLIVIIYLAYSGIGAKKMEMWKKENKGKMRLGVGLMLLAVGVWIVSAVYDWLLIYLISGVAAITLVMFLIWKSGAHKKLKKHHKKLKEKLKEREYHDHEHRNALFFIGGLIIGTLIGIMFVTSGFPALSFTGNSINVDIVDDAPWFKPAVLEIKPGTTVTWHLKSPAVHPVMSLDKPDGVEEFNSGHFLETWSYKFDKPGIYVYICPIHPYMKGVIGVGQNVPKEKIPP